MYKLFLWFGMSSNTEGFIFFGALGIVVIILNYITNRCWNNY